MFPVASSISNWLIIISYSVQRQGVVGVLVGVWVGVWVGVGVGGISGHSKAAVQTVPDNGAVTTIVTVDGNALVLLNDIVPNPGPETFG